MARPLSAALIAAIQARTVRLALLADMYFPAGSTFAWTGPYPLTANGRTYVGLGGYGAIGKVEERNDGTVTGVALTLNGVSPAMISTALSTNYQGAACNLWFACFDTNWAIIMDPYQIFAGTMDVMSIQDNVSTASITLSLENRMVETQRARTRRFTDPDQRINYPSDSGFQFVNAIQLIQIYWGNPNGPTGNLGNSAGVTANVA